MIKNDTDIEIINDIIIVGYELESCYKHRWSKGISSNLKRFVKIRIEELKKRDIDIVNGSQYSSYIYTDDNGISWELEYALQFI